MVALSVKYHMVGEIQSPGFSLYVEQLISYYHCSGHGQKARIWTVLLL